MSKRRVVCSAIRAEDGTILTGIRHYSKDMHESINNRVDGWKFHHRYDEDQGFVDQYGMYMTRKEAYSVAFYAGQIINEAACGNCELYSEGLY